VCGSVPARVVDVRPSNVTLLVGASASLVCSASGDPVPLVRWLRHDADELAGRVAGEPGVGHGLLAISNATLREDGWYECEADNGVGAPHRRAVYVDVLGTPAPGVCRERESIRELEKSSIVTKYSKIDFSKTGGDFFRQNFAICTG